MRSCRRLAYAVFTLEETRGPVGEEDTRDFYALEASENDGCVVSERSSGSNADTLEVNARDNAPYVSELRICKPYGQTRSQMHPSTASTLH